MYVIAVYDVASERTGKMLKLCRRYLHWVQNSVFEGEITAVRLQELILAAKEIMDEQYDSLIIFENDQVRKMNRRIIGQEKASTNQFL